MADVTITYKGSTIATMNASGSKSLGTAGKYCEGNINVSYVKPSGGTPTLQTKTVAPTESTQTVSPDSGYDGLSSVTVNAISSTHVGSGVTRKAAQTYTPRTTAQTIAAQQYLIGAQTIAGDANLVPANIKSGVSIFGVQGSLSPGGSGSSDEITYDSNFMIGETSNTHMFVFVVPAGEFATGLTSISLTGDGVEAFVNKYIDEINTARPNGASRWIAAGCLNDNTAIPIFIDGTNAYGTYTLEGSTYEIYMSVDLYLFTGMDGSITDSYIEIQLSGDDPGCDIVMYLVFYTDGLY